MVSYIGVGLGCSLQQEEEEEANEEKDEDKSVGWADGTRTKFSHKSSDRLPVSESRIEHCKPSKLFQSAEFITHVVSTMSSYGRFGKSDINGDK